MGRMIGVLALAALLGGGSAAAHEKGDRAMGLVERVTEATIVVKASDGHLVEFALTPQTRFFRGEAAARREDVRTGERAAVHGKKAGDGYEAVRVRLGAAP